MAITFIAHDEKVSTTGNNVTTNGVDTSGANLIVIVETLDGGAAILPTDSNSNTWTGLTAKGTTPLLRFYYCFNPTVGAAHTFTLTTANHSPSIAIQAFSLTATFDKETGATATQPGSLTPTGNNELLITAGSYNLVTAPTVDAPFSSNLTASFTGAAHNYALGMAYEIQTTATARNPTWVISGNAVSIMAAFTAVSGGPFPHYTRRRMHGGTLGMSGGARMRTDDGEWFKVMEVPNSN